MIKELINKPGLGNIIIMLIISLLIILIGPYISFGHNNPFASIGARSLIIGLMFGVYGLKCLIIQIIRQRQQFLPQLLQHYQRIKQHSLDYSSRAVTKLKIGKFNWRERLDKQQQRRRIQKLPWYLVLGSPQSGKNQLMKKSNINFISPLQFGKEAEQYQQHFPDYDWWLSHEAVFVACNNTNYESDVLSLKRFIKYLRKQRRRTPINGVILAFNLSDLLLATNQQRQHAIAVLGQKIQTLHRGLHSQLPIYITFTQCDLVAGFSEFFNDLSQEELSQIWGMTFPLANCDNANNILDQFTTEYNNLMLRLQQRVLWALDADKSLVGRELIFSFPQQMQLFKKPIQTFISELFASCREQQLFAIRGIYFTSAQQGATPYDFLQAAIGKQFQLVHNAKSQNNPREESYFLSQFFYDVLLKEGQVLGDSKRTQRIKGLIYKISLIGVPLLIIGGISAMAHGYHENRDLITKLQHNLKAYHYQINSLQADDRDITHTLPSLNALSRSNDLANGCSWMAHLFWNAYSMQDDTHQALQRELHVLFLPRIAAHLEDALTQAQSDNTNVLYAMLKGYLAFSPSNYTEPSAVVAPMEFAWSQRLHNKVHEHAELTHYLHLSASDRLDMLPLNRPLINIVRLKLQQIIPADRAYGLLTFKAAASDIASLDFSNIIGSGYRLVFDDKRPLSYIPALYTLTGFKDVFLKQQHSIAHQVADDNREIGLNDTTTQSTNDIQQQIAMNYNAQYINHWQMALHNITIKPFHSVKQALTLLSILSNSHSPLKQLLDLVDHNTDQINHNAVTVSHHFKSLNAYTDNIAEGVTYSATEKIFKALKNRIDQIQQAPDSNKANYLEAKDVLSGNAKNPLNQLSLLAAKSPAPLKAWLQSIVLNTWMIITNGAYAYLNDAWQAQVVTLYQNNIAHRYPVYRLAQSEISIEHFSHFFGPKGTLSHYFNHYLKPFVNTDGKTWTLYQVHGLHFPLHQQQLALFRQAARIAKHYFPSGDKAK